MNRWIILAIVVLGFCAAGLIFLISRICKFPAIKKITEGSRIKRILLSFLIVTVCCILLYLTLGMVNCMICIIHVAVIWLITDLVSFLICKIRKRKPKGYPAGLLAILLSVLYLSYGWYNAHNIVETDYVITTEKDLGGKDLRVVMFADSHVGATFHADRFAEYTKEMEALSPDVVVLVGDFIDDDTTKEDMLACCKALGEIKATYGVYFVYGNHDRGYFRSEEKGYGPADLAEALRANNVTILQDEAPLIDGRFYLIGREDASIRNRADMTALTAGLDPDKYQIVLDHQPHDYKAQEEAGVDLVLSGHTHGGWLFPFNNFGEKNGVDDKTYGREKRSNTEFIVTSGISEWALKFKTGTISEYVVIDIRQEG